MKCPKCGIEYEGSICPICGESSTLSLKKRSNRKIKILGTVAFVFAVLLVISGTALVAIKADRNQPTATIPQSQSTNPENSDYLSWAASDWNNASNEEKRAAATAYTKYIIEESGYLFNEELLKDNIDNFFDILDTGFKEDTVGTVTLKDLAEYVLDNEESNSSQNNSDSTKSEPSAMPSKPNQEQAATITPEQKNALNKAKSYLSLTAFSRSGLIHQLEFEGYSTQDATYAVDNCGANWNDLAIKKAKSYLSHSSFSKQSLVEQLEFEGYTHKEAIYGVDRCGADWDEQAAKKAKSYLSHSSFSRKGLIDQLLFEGFTQEQAEYGVTAAGL